MSARKRRRVVAGVIAALVMVALLIFALQAWLGTGVGRGVVESRLSTVLGRPVRLDGEFRVGLLPVPGASGTEMKIYTPDGRWLALEAGRYLAELALWPLLNGEVEVVALGLAEAGLDLARLASVQTVGTDHAGPFSQLPAVRSFELENMALYFDGMRSQPHLRIGSLSVDDFQVDAPAAFESTVSLVSGEAEALKLSLQGEVTLKAEGWVEMDLSSIDIAIDGWGASALKGNFLGDFERSELKASVFSNSTVQPFGVSARVAWDPVFSGGETGYLIEELQFRNKEQWLTGSGCLMDGTPPVLNLSFSAADLDLDALQALLDEFRGPDYVTAPGASPEREEEAGLPFELALLLEVENATFGNVVAEGARLRTGPMPECPDIL